MPVKRKPNAASARKLFDRGTALMLQKKPDAARAANSARATAERLAPVVRAFAAATQAIVAKGARRAALRDLAEAIGALGATQPLSPADGKPANGDPVDAAAAHEQALDYLLRSLQHDLAALAKPHGGATRDDSTADAMHAAGPFHRRRPSAPMNVAEAILSRHSMRVFEPRPVPREALEKMIDVARYAASNGNLQPWKLYVTSGAARLRLSAAIRQAIASGDNARTAEYDTYPRQFRPPYDQRRKKVGKDLYTLLDVPKGDAAGMQRQFLKNFDFFDAPTGMILTLDRDMGHGQWVDCGIFLDQLMLMARELGLHSCPQGAFAYYQHIVRRELAIPELEIVICGLAVGYANPAEVPNNLVTERAAVSDFTVFIDS